MANLSNEQKEFLQGLINDGHVIDEYETWDLLAANGFSEEQIPEAFQTLDTLQAQFDADMQEALLQVQEANAHAAEEQAAQDLKDDIYRERYNNDVSPEEFSEIQTTAEQSHTLAEGLGAAETHETGMWGDEVNAGDTLSARVDSGRGADTIISEAESNLINAGKGDDSITITSDVNSTGHDTHVLDGGAGTDHYTINVTENETAYYSQEDGRAYLNGERDTTVIAELEAGESVTLNFEEGVDIPEWATSAKELLAHANVQLTGDVPSGMDVETQALPDGGTSVTITR